MRLFNLPKNYRYIKNDKTYYRLSKTIQATNSIDFDRTTNFMFTVKFTNISTVSCLGNEPFTKVYQLVTCGNDHYVKLWEITVIQSKCETSNVKISLCRIMEKHSSALTCVCFNANGLFIASSGLDKTAVIWETVRNKRNNR